MSSTLRDTVSIIRVVVRHLAQEIACVFFHCLGLCNLASAQVSLVGESDGDWTALTMAPNSSWGTATESVINGAIANAIARCQAMSHRKIGCGAYIVSIQRGWSLGLRCGDENIIAAASTLADPRRAALVREKELRQRYHPEMETCRQVVTVTPDGAVITPNYQTISSDLKVR